MRCGASFTSFLACKAEAKPSSPSRHRGRILARRHARQRHPAEECYCESQYARTALEGGCHDRSAHPRTRTHRPARDDARLRRDGLRGAPRARDISEAQAETILNAVLDAGINYIDTSI